jgi:exodeoxyribonuclease VII large subunit
MALSPAPDAILTVAALTRLIKEALESEFPAVWVRGEITNCKRADSGHLYFSLKDASKATLSCMMWRDDAARLRFAPRDGTEVEAFGRIEVYPPRGSYQLVVGEMRPGGLGALLIAFEELKRKLQAEGLFEAARKRPLPRYPRRIGLVTSPVGAAVRDLVTVLRARWRPIEIVIAPTRVQGEGAALEIAAAIRRFDRYGGVDVLIVGRGGGSLEDLWAFNEEPVVRAIVASRIPVISAVGHEVDVTLADLAADVRAATPSNAAELAVRDAREIHRRVGLLESRLAAAVRRGIADRRRHVLQLTGKYGFRRQKDGIGIWQQRIDDLAGRLRGALDTRLARARARLAAVQRRYGLREPPRALTRDRQRIAARERRLSDAVVRAAFERRGRLGAFGDRLRALSPRLVLERGYCLARGPDGTLVRAADALRVKDRVALEFARGGAEATIEAIRAGETDDG